MKIISDYDGDVLVILDRAYRENLDIDDDIFGGYLPEAFVEHGYYGEGFGNIFSALKSVWSFIKPVIKPVAKAVGKQALSSGIGYLGDLASGADWKEAAKERAKEAGTNLKRKAEEKIAAMAGSGVKRRRLNGQFMSNSDKNRHWTMQSSSYIPSTRRRGGRRRKALGATPRRRKRRTTRGGRVTKRRKGIRRRRRQRGTVRKKTSRRKRRVQRGGRCGRNFEGFGGGDFQSGWL